MKIPLLLTQILLVAAGGAGGASCRFLVGKFTPTPGGFPLGTLTVNLLGCLLIGLLVNVEDRTRLILVTGFLGGFTTYSAFGLESIKLLQERPAQAALYIGIHVFLGLAACWLGMSLVSGSE